MKSDAVDTEGFRHAARSMDCPPGRPEKITCTCGREFEQTARTPAFTEHLRAVDARPHARHANEARQKLANARARLDGPRGAR